MQAALSALPSSPYVRKSRGRLGCRWKRRPSLGHKARVWKEVATSGGMPVATGSWKRRG